MLIDGRRIESDAFEQAEVCIVGAGSGGSALARELAERGAAVLVLEEGPLLEEGAAAWSVKALGWPRLPIELSHGVGGAGTPAGSAPPEGPLRREAEALGLQAVAGTLRASTRRGELLRASEAGAHRNAMQGGAHPGPGRRRGERRGGVAPGGCGATAAQRELLCSRPVRRGGTDPAAHGSERAGARASRSRQEPGAAACGAGARCPGRRPGEEAVAKCPSSPRTRGSRGVESASNSLSNN
jgi:putative NAD(P)-binding protein